MAGKIIADTIEASGSQISLNVGNVTILTASSTGLTLIPTTNVNVNLTNSIVTLTSGNVARPSLTFSGNTTTGIFMPAANTIAFGTAGTEDMRIDSSGNVGIGTNSPAEKLDVQGNIRLTGADTSVKFVNAGGYDFSIRANTGNALEFYSPEFTANPLMSLTNNGNLLVGTTSAFTGTYAVNIMGATSNRAYLGLKRETASTTGVCGSIQSFNGSNNVTSIDFQSNGANNSGLIQTYTWSAGSVVQGPYVNTGGTSWTTASDETLKDIIAPIENATSKLSGLRTVFGKYKTDHSDVRRIFLIAQDVQAVLPEAVNLDTNGKLGLNYQDLVPVLVAAIKELKVIVDAQAVEIAALKAK